MLGKAGEACVHGIEKSCPTLIGQSGRRMGQEEQDKMEGRGCAMVLSDTQGGHVRDIRSGGGRSARRGKAEPMPARCLSKWLPT
jgi:hypothetical protein